MTKPIVWISVVAVPLLYELTRSFERPCSLVLAFGLHWLLAGAVLTWATTDPDGRMRRIGLRRPTAGFLWFAVVIATYCAVLIAAFGTRPLADWQYSQIHFGRWGVIVTAISAGFCEEIVFRGYMMTALKQAGQTPWVAMTLSSLSFVLFHGILPLPMMVAGFLIGMIFAALYQKTNSLWTPVYVHGIWDATVLLVPMNPSAP